MYWGNLNSSMALIIYVFRSVARKKFVIVNFIFNSVLPNIYIEGQNKGALCNSFIS